MALYKITAPDPKFVGEVGGVGFYKGVANRVDGDTHSAALSYCVRRGYTVEALDVSAAPESEQENSDDSRPAKSASKATWETYAVAQGMPADEAKATSRDQLAERFHGPKGDDQK